MNRESFLHSFQHDNRSYLQELNEEFETRFNDLGFKTTNKAFACNAEVNIDLQVRFIDL